MQYLKILITVLCSTASIFAQNQIQTVEEEQLWLGYFNQTRLSDKWGFWADIHYRGTEHFVKEPSKILLRGGLTYYLNDDVKLTNGYTFVNHFPEEGHANVSQSEHRIWQQLQYHSKFGKTRIMNWLRLEERFRRKIKNDNELADGYRFDLRLRSNFLLNIPLSKKGIAPKTFSAILNEEIFINFPNSSNSTYLPFDQNRFFVGLAYNLDTHSNIQFGYMNVYQQLSAGTKFRNTDAIRVFFFQNFDLRKKKS
ncbi:MAG: DUF2490 domain-containing protein [Arcicella sp.]|jgi:hypothetical protein|nr:DUF2490 domain-containing protein [Arcicella sp.]